MPASDRSRRQANAAGFLPPVVLLAGKEVSDPAAEPGSDAVDRTRGAVLAEVVPREWQRRWAVEDAAGRWQRGLRAEQPAFRSTVLYCEMKFNQALELCRELGPGSPSHFVTLAACECLQLLLTTLAEPAWPLARVLCAELYRSIYSDYDLLTTAPRNAGAGAHGAPPAAIGGARATELVRAPTVAHVPFFDELRRVHALLAKAEAGVRHFDGMAESETAALFRRSRQLTELTDKLVRIADAAPSRALLAGEQVPHAPGASAADDAPSELRARLSTLLAELTSANDELGSAISLFLARPATAIVERAAQLDADSRAELASAVLERFGAEAFGEMGAAELTHTLRALLASNGLDEGVAVIGALAADLAAEGEGPRMTILRSVLGPEPTREMCEAVLALLPVDAADGGEATAATLDDDDAAVALSAGADGTDGGHSGRASSAERVARRTREISALRARAALELNAQFAAATAASVHSRCSAAVACASAARCGGSVGSLPATPTRLSAGSSRFARQPSAAGGMGRCASHAAAHGERPGTSSSTGDVSGSSGTLRRTSRQTSAGVRRDGGSRDARGPSLRAANAVVAGGVGGRDRPGSSGVGASERNIGALLSHGLLGPCGTHMATGAACATGGETHGALSPSAMPVGAAAEWDAEKRVEVSLRALRERRVAAYALDGAALSVAPRTLDLLALRTLPPVGASADPRAQPAAPGTAGGAGTQSGAAAGAGDGTSGARQPPAWLATPNTFSAGGQTAANASTGAAGADAAGAAGAPARCGVAGVPSLVAAVAAQSVTNGGGVPPDMLAWYVEEAALQLLAAAAPVGGSLVAHAPVRGVLGVGADGGGPLARGAQLAHGGGVAGEGAVFVGNESLSVLVSRQPVWEAEARWAAAGLGAADASARGALARGASAAAHERDKARERERSLGRAAVTPLHASRRPSERSASPCTGSTSAPIWKR
ncbi:hypothetical protein KFE25_003454 [Diacronema lutheri]|uniref:Uncharacterized protein n=1 Tax=Diacronema lutheri TaxID=2081491 RepID=A0A8J6CAS3_DIALT|nr:hypothetical protein KFE25_003454 [Diacronema lutheri]